MLRSGVSTRPSAPRASDQVPILILARTGLFALKNSESWVLILARPHMIPGTGRNGPPRGPAVPGHPGQGGALWLSIFQVLHQFWRGRQYQKLCGAARDLIAPQTELKSSSRLQNGVDYLLGCRGSARLHHHLGFPRTLHSSSSGASLTLFIPSFPTVSRPFRVKTPIGVTLQID